jgi:hypothetical protein
MLRRMPQILAQITSGRWTRYSREQSEPRAAKSSVQHPFEIGGDFRHQFDLTPSERAKTMKSTLDEVLSLLNKWKADKKLLVIAVSDGDPSNPDSFLFKITGTVKEISSTWVGIAGGPSYCCLRLVRPGARYDYIELRDPGFP